MGNVAMDRVYTVGTRTFRRLNEKFWVAFEKDGTEIARFYKGNVARELLENLREVDKASRKGRGFKGSLDAWKVSRRHQLITEARETFAAEQELERRAAEAKLNMDRTILAHRNVHQESAGA